MFLNVASITNETDLAYHLKNGAWPVCEQEKFEIYNGLLDGCRDLLLSIDESFDQNIIKALSPLLLGQAMALLYSNLVISRLDNIEVVKGGYKPSEIDYFSWSLLGGAVDVDIVERYIRRHVNWKKKLKATAMSKWRHDTSAVILSPNPTLNKFLKLNAIEATLVSLPELFPIKSFQKRHSELYKTSKLSNRFFDGLMANLSSTYYDKHCFNSIKTIIKVSVEFAAQELEQLLLHSHARRVKHLLTGNQGYVGTRLVSLAVIENGGVVSGFPHSGAMHAWSTNRWLIDELTVSRAYYYTKWEEDIKKTAYANIRKKYPVQICQLGGEQHCKPGNHPVVISERIKHVLYIGAGYAGDRPFPLVLPEPVRLSLEMSILDSLVAMDLKITLKFHRKSKSQKRLQKIFFERYKDRVDYIDEPLTNYLKRGQKFDAFISENLLGGSLSEVVKTKTPVILVSPFQNHLLYEVRRRLEQRIWVVPCQNNARNMIKVDSNKLSEVINRVGQSISMEYTYRATNNYFEY